MNDHRTKLQSKLERTRWVPFSFVTPIGAVVSNPPAEGHYKAAADIATMAIIKMLFECRPRQGLLDQGSTKS